MILRLLQARHISKAFAHVSAKDAPALRCLLQRGLDPNATRNHKGTTIEQSLLLFAVEEEACACVRELLGAGANPNQFDEVGQSPFLAGICQMSEGIRQKRLGFTVDLPYETHPVMEAVVDMFVHGGARRYRPPGYVSPVVLGVAGPSPHQRVFEATIDAWLVIQAARLRQRRLEEGLPADAASIAARPGGRL